MPESTIFGPMGGSGEGELIIMAVEEYETIRLIDHEGLTQEECAERMNVARTTVQGIYSEARKKLADFLVHGGVLRIEGGDYKLCEDSDERYGCGRCQRQRRRRNMQSQRY